MKSPGQGRGSAQGPEGGPRVSAWGRGNRGGRDPCPGACGAELGVSPGLSQMNAGELPAIPCLCSQRVHGSANATPRLWALQAGHQLLRLLHAPLLPPRMQGKTSVSSGTPNLPASKDPPCPFTQTPRPQGPRAEPMGSHVQLALLPKSEDPSSWALFPLVASGQLSLSRGARPEACALPATPVVPHHCSPIYTPCPTSPPAGPLGPAKLFLQLGLQSEIGLGSGPHAPWGSQRSR